MNIKGKKVIIFDGVCNLCSWTVRFVIRRDMNRIFLFAASQSDSGKQILKKFDIEELWDKSIVLVQGDSVLVRSEAVLEIFKYLRGPWKYVRYLKIFPKFILDWKYSLISRIRYRIFGKKDSCMVPNEEVKERFLI